MSYAVNDILLATDLGPGSAEALAQGLRFARLFGARLHLLTVLQPSPYTGAFVDDMDREAVARLRGRLIQHTRDELEAQVEACCAAQADAQARSRIASVQVLEGGATQLILDETARLGVGFILLGSHGHSAFGELLLGSIAHKVTVKANVPVLLVPLNR